MASTGWLILDSRARTSKEARASQTAAYPKRSADCSECNNVVAVSGWFSRNPAGNQRSTEPGTMIGVPEVRTVAARSVHIDGLPNLAVVKTSAAHETRSGG